MKIRDYIESLEIDPTEEFLSQYKLVKKYDKAFSYSQDNHPCLNCGDKLNNFYPPSAAWTSVQYCWKCHSLNVVFHQDRMGGIYTDVIECYQDKDE